MLSGVLQDILQRWAVNYVKGQPKQKSEQTNHIHPAENNWDRK